MTATIASDESGVEYYFECTAGGGHDSGWQDSPMYEDTGLQAETEYTYRVKARDKSPNQNETAWSNEASAMTEALPNRFLYLPFVAKNYGVFRQTRRVLISQPFFPMSRRDARR